MVILGSSFGYKVWFKKTQAKSVNEPGDQNLINENQQNSNRYKFSLKICYVIQTDNTAMTFTGSKSVNGVLASNPNKR